MHILLWVWECEYETSHTQSSVSYQNRFNISSGERTVQKGAKSQKGRALPLTAKPQRWVQPWIRLSAGSSQVPSTGPNVVWSQLRQPDSLGSSAGLWNPCGSSHCCQPALAEMGTLTAVGSHSMWHWLQERRQTLRGWGASRDLQACSNQHLIYYGWWKHFNTEQIIFANDKLPLPDTYKHLSPFIPTE